jgi:hypothetical protein
VVQSATKATGGSKRGRVAITIGQFAGSRAANNGVFCSRRHHQFSCGLLWSDRELKPEEKRWRGILVDFRSVESDPKKAKEKLSQPPPAVRQMLGFSFYEEVGSRPTERQLIAPF